MIFSLRQLLESACEFSGDLIKVADTVSRGALGLALRKLGVPGKMLSVTISFH